MKIAIFGDSYGSVSLLPLRKLDQKSNSWVNHLKRLTANEHSITNYCKSGSSLFYSINLFLEHHTEYDRVIFLTTSQGRIELDNSFINSLKSIHFQQHLTSHDHAIELIKKFKDQEFDCLVYQAVADYFVYVQNPNCDKFVQSLMVEKIKSVKPDTLIIPCFGESLEDDRFQLNLVSNIDLQHYNYHKKTVMGDHRHCHMNDENNIIMAEKIYNWIKTNNISLDISDFVNPSEPPEYYGF